MKKRRPHRVSVVRGGRMILRRMLFLDKIDVHLPLERFLQQIWVSVEETP